MTNFYTTLADLRKHHACYEGYNRLVRSLQGKPFSQDDADRESYIRIKHTNQISLVSILESNGLDDALWSLRTVPLIERDCRLYAVWCARRVQQFMLDDRCINALDVAEAFASGNASATSLIEARNDARAASLTAPYNQAQIMSHDASYSTIRSPVAAQAALDAATDSIYCYASIIDRNIALNNLKEMFIKMCNGQAPWQAGVE